MDKETKYDSIEFQVKRSLDIVDFRINAEVITKLNI